MPASIPTPSLHSGSGDAVAAYRNARGAALAAAELAARGFPGDAVRIRPADMAVAPATCRPRVDRIRIAGLAALLGGAVTAVASWLLLDSAVSGSIVAVFGGILAACIASAVGSALARRHNRQLDEAARFVHAGRFEVVVTERSDEANHLLARWWEPEAAPVPAPHGAGERAA